MQADLHELIQHETGKYQQKIAQGYEVPAWILPEPSCELVEKLGAFLGPQALAFEFGSGTSTVTLRRLFAGVTSLEDSPEWLEKLEKLPDIAPKRPEDATRAVALTRCYLGMLPYHSFYLDKRIELLRRLEQADLILIDSPPNPATREHVLITALQCAKAGALILIDDPGGARHPSILRTAWTRQRKAPRLHLCPHRPHARLVSQADDGAH